jgi:hypothetical protein
MNLITRFFFCVTLTLIPMAIGTFATFAQADVIDKVFSDKPVNFRSEIEIVDTLLFDHYYYDPYEGYAYDSYFGAEDFEHFLIYRHKTLNKLGLIVYGETDTKYTEPAADSIYYIKARDNNYNEVYDEQGNFLSYNYVANNLYFGFSTSGKENIWKLDFTDGQYHMADLGVAQKGIFKAVGFSRVADDEYTTLVNAVFANVSTNEIVSSAVLNENFVYANAYYYDYSYYGDYYYEGEYEYTEEVTEETGYDNGTFETSMNYSPVVFTYFMQGDTISELIDGRYLDYTADPFKNVVPEDFEGAWKFDGEYETYVIISDDNVMNDYASIVSIIDGYEGMYEVATLSWDEMIKKTGMNKETQAQLENSWTGPKADVRFIATTGFLVQTRFREFFIQNNENLVHVTIDYDGASGVTWGIDQYKPEKVYSDYIVASYDPYTYVTTYQNMSQKPYDLMSAGVEYYYYDMLGADERNTDKQGNLVLTSESLGTINFKGYTAGNYYLGKIKVSWVGGPEFGEGSKVVTLSNEPYKILDETGKVLADDVATMYVETVQGLNLLMITGSDGKMGVLGPDGNWLVKRDYQYVGIQSASSSSYNDYYYYETTRSFPIFFMIGQDSKFGLMDTKGNWVVPMSYDNVEMCSKDIIVTKDGMIGIYSREGKKILDPEYLAAGYYGGGYTDCYSLDSYMQYGLRILLKGDKVGALNDEYQTVIPFEYTSLTPLGEDKIIAINADNRSGMINMAGEVLVPFDYEMIYAVDYVVDRYVVTKDGKQGIIDGDGNVLIPIQYQSIQSTADWVNNFLLVYDENYYTNAIDTTGVSIIESGCLYIYYYPDYAIFSCGVESNYSFYDRSGNLLYAKISSYIDPYNAYENVQIIPDSDYENPKFGAFDLSTGEEILPNEFETIYPIWISDQMFLVGQKNGKIGIYDRTGKMLVKPKGTYLDNYFYDYKEDGNYGYFVEISNKKGKSKIIELQDFEYYYYNYGYGE